MNRLRGKSSLITGAGGGIGRDVAHRFAQEGARVGAVDLDAAGVTALAAELGAEHLALRADISSEHDVSACVTRVAERFGGLDIVVHCAAIGVERAFLDIALEEWERLLRINLTGTFLVARAAVRAMLAAGGGSLVTFASTAGERGSARRAAYGATKAGVINLTQAIAIEFGARGIRANVVSPGPIDTELVARMHAADTRRAFEQRVPMGRYGQTREVADAVVFLASDEASYINGHVLRVDGGFAAACIMT